MRQSDLRQVHPLTLVYETLISVVRIIKVIFPLIIVQFLKSSSRGEGVDPLTYGVGVLAIISALFAYFTVRYGFDGTSFVYRSQVPWKKEEKVIPIERIQEVEFKRNLLHKLLGLVEVKIDTGAANKKAEVELSALKMEDALALRTEIYSKRGITTTPEMIEKQPDKVIFKASWKHLVLAGLGSNAAFLILASAFGLMSEVNRDDRSGLMQKIFGFLSTLDPSKNLFGFLLALLGLFLFGWIIGIGKSVLSLYGFTLTRDGDRLIRRSGLLSEVQKSSPISRIQGIEIQEKLIHRLMGLAQVKVGFTMGAARTEGESDQLCPIIERDLVHKITDIVYPNLKIPTQFGWDRPTVTIFFRHAWLGFLIYAGIIIAVQYFPTYRTIGSVLVGILMVRFLVDCVLWAKNYGWKLDDDHLFLQSGGLRLSTAIVSLKGIQKVSCDQSFMQRRLQLCDVSVCTASTGVGASETIMNVSVKLGNELMTHLMKMAASEPIPEPVEYSEEAQIPPIQTSMPPPLPPATTS